MISLDVLNISISRWEWRRGDRWRLPEHEFVGVVAAFWLSGDGVVGRPTRMMIPFLLACPPSFHSVGAGDSLKIRCEHKAHGYLSYRPFCVVH